MYYRVCNGCDDHCHLDPDERCCGGEQQEETERKPQELRSETVKGICLPGQREEVRLCG